jgi:hypothetical protein
MGYGPSKGFSHYDPSNFFSNLFSRTGLSSLGIFTFLSLVGMDINSKSLSLESSVLASSP